MVYGKMLKQQAKNQLKGRYLVPLTASIIVSAVTIVSNFIKPIIEKKAPYVSIPFSITFFCINAILGFALIYVCQKSTRTKDALCFSDYTDGLSLIKPAICGSLWKMLFMTLWGLLILLPAIISSIVLIAIASINLLDFTNLQNFNFSFFQDAANIESFFSKVITSYLWAFIIIMICFVLLTIVLIIKIIQYSLIHFVLAENPKCSVKKALKLSVKLTKGNKGELFGLIFSFIWWFLLCTVPSIICGIINAMPSNFTIPDSFRDTLTMIAISFILPYMTTTYANAYNTLKTQVISGNTVKPEDFEN